MWSRNGWPRLSSTREAGHGLPGRVQEGPAPSRSIWNTHLLEVVHQGPVAGQFGLVRPAPPPAARPRPPGRRSRPDPGAGPRRRPQGRQMPGEMGVEFHGVDQWQRFRGNPSILSVGPAKDGAGLTRAEKNSCFFRFSRPCLGSQVRSTGPPSFHPYAIRSHHGHRQ